jgi:4-amino-4-deoxy-L-arabinose transferase-like glycosyltransferase
LVLAGVLLATVLFRMIRLDQPIVENYVGRQVPTAMVARNLERCSSFFWPRLDTEPYPNYFLVEPPLYELAVVGLRRVWGWRLEACGRIVSAGATALGAWALFGLVRRRDGERAALAATIAFAFFPITLRYGRAFQPDALMLGAILAGLDFWDRVQERSSRWWLVPGWLILALGLAAKISSAFALVPLAIGVERRRIGLGMLLAASALLPVLSWYVWANHLVETAGGSRASAENQAIWLGVLGFPALGHPETLAANLWRFLVVRAFTPVGLVLAAWGLCLRQEAEERPDFWRAWAVSALVMMALLAEKLHHEYYWLSLAPAAAAGLGRAWVKLVAWSRGLASALGLLVLVSSLLLARTTWQTPAEWRDLETAARQVQEVVPLEARVVAPEPLLFVADRRGCRLEFTPRAAARARAEWPGQSGTQVAGPLDLVDFYRTRGARFVADVGPAPDDTPRIALHREIRQRYKVLIDNASVIIADLSTTERIGNGR